MFFAQIKKYINTFSNDFESNFNKELFNATIFCKMYVVLLSLDRCFTVLSSSQLPASSYESAYDALDF